MKPDEYKKKCPYCGKEFIANHLSRSYCTEKCKRRKFRSKKQEDRILYENNNNILAKLYRISLHPYVKRELIDAGYNPNYTKDSVNIGDRTLVTYERYYLEIFNDSKIIIQKKL